MKKPVFYAEAAYLIGVLLLALGTALTEYGGLGISMVVAPAYLLHLYFSQYWPAFTFGVAEYTLQALLLAGLFLALPNRKISYLFSFVTAVLYGFSLDGAMMLTALLPANNTLLQILVYTCGVVICTAAISLLFHSYLPPEVYELLVSRISQTFQKPIHTVKTWYDFCSLLCSILLSLLFFGKIQAIGPGTVLCAFLNGFLIRQFTRLFESLFEFQDRFSLRSYF